LHGEKSDLGLPVDAADRAAIVRRPPQEALLKVDGFLLQIGVT